MSKPLDLAPYKDFPPLPWHRIVNIPPLVEELEKWRELGKRIQFQGEIMYYPNGDPGERLCPECGLDEYEKHTEDCALAALLPEEGAK